MGKKVVIMRGLPGSGKSTYCRTRWHDLTPWKYAKLSHPTVSVSADHFFEFGDEYHFDPTKLGDAHATATCQLIDALTNGTSTVVVDNTHVCHWEWKVAQQLAETFGYDVEIVSLFDGGLTDEELASRNSHGVPLVTIQSMRKRWLE